MEIEREEYEWFVKTIHYLISEYDGTKFMFPTKNRLDDLEEKYGRLPDATGKEM